MKELSKKEEEEVKQIFKKTEDIEKESTLSWDGGNLVVKIPQEICDFLGINEQNRFEKSILWKIKENTDGTIEKTFDVIKRIKKRKIRKNGKKKTPDTK